MTGPVGLAGKETGKVPAPLEPSMVGDLDRDHQSQLGCLSFSAGVGDKKR